VRYLLSRYVLFVAVGITMALLYRFVL